MAKDLLFEVGCEEIPARFIEPALRSMKELATSFLGELSLSFEEVRCLGTPRRLTLFVKGLAEKQPDRVEEVIGPPKSVAVDEDGNFTKAALGFAKKQGVDPSQLKVKKTPKGEYLCVERHIPGRPTKELLPDILTKILSSISFPKTMRWGDHEFRFARPIRWMLALYGDEVVPLEVAGVKSGDLTFGHRFLSPSPIKVSSFDEYLEKLKEAWVIVDPEERKKRTWEEVVAAAKAVRGEVERDEALLEENAHLVEYPFALLGSFPERYLELPEAVIVTAMKEHQRYFCVRDSQGRLAPYFVSVNNNRPRSWDVLRKGHERVLKARLEDARFYYERDLRVPLSERVKELEGVVYHTRLGTLYHKTERLKALCGFLAERLFPEVKDKCLRAAELAKADLVCELVKEFPDLQGEMGAVYALKWGESEEVASAIREQYLPRGAGDELPKSSTGIVLSLADKFDSLCAFFGIGERPTGATDPFGLRRAAYGILKILIQHKLHLSLRSTLVFALWMLKRQGFLFLPEDEVQSALLSFVERRLEGELLSEGFPLEEVRAVVRVGFDDPYDAFLRLVALNRMRKSKEFEDLVVGFKRVMNMVKKQKGRLEFREDLLVEPAEEALWKRFLEVSDETLPLLKEKRYEKALKSFVKLKEPIDRFFDEVFVMVEDKALRINRLALLSQVAELFLEVADLSLLYESQGASGSP